MNVGPETIARLCGTVGHELRNPLAAAVAGVSLAAELLDPGDPRRSVLDAALADLDRLGRLLDSYLDFARTGRARRAPCTVAGLCAGIAARHPDAVRVDLRGEPAVLGDRDLLERALENLVENALQAGARNVVLRARLDGACVRLDVDDDGPGVPADLATRIFEPGFSRRGGTGLGLAIVAATVRAHDGEVRCERSPGAGTRFAMALPAAVACRVGEAVTA